MPKEPKEIVYPEDPPASFFPRRVWLLPALLLPLSWLVGWAIQNLSSDQMDIDLKNITTFSVLAGALLLSALWMIFRTKWSRSLKWSVVGVGMLAVSGAAIALEFNEFSGDMVPQFAWRWTPKAYELVQAPKPQAPVNAETPPADLTKTTELDYPQFQGARRDGRAATVPLARDWVARPPKQLWKQEIGGGWAAFAVVGSYAVTLEQRGDDRLVVCYEVETGKVAWSHAEPGLFTSVLGGDGPRATPVIDEGKVYAQFSDGLLVCLDGHSGVRRWSRNILEENDAPQISWGRSGSPLVADGLVIVSAGGQSGNSLIAYNKDTGEPVWSVGTDRASYASPALATIGEVKQVLSVNEDWLTAHALDDGHVLWRHSWPGNSDSNANVSQPVPVSDDRVFLSKGYGQGCQLMQVLKADDGKFSTLPIWQDATKMKTKMTNVVLHEGHVYGLSGGILECIELDVGRRKWKKGRYGHGQILGVGDLLLVTTETGDVVLLEASPDEHRELAKLKVFDEKTWNPPALAGKYLLVRNHVEAACYELPLVAE